MRIIQVLPTLAYGDAIGNETIALKDFFREAGYDSEIYYINGIDYRIPKDTAQEITKIRLSIDDVLIYHLSSGTQWHYNINDYHCHKIIRYHNITPPYFFEGYHDRLQRICQEGYEGTKYLSNKVEFVLADSDYNLQDLRNMGYDCPGEVAPIFLNLKNYEQRSDEKVLKQVKKKGFTNFLFTGRIAPNKKMEDTIRAFYCYHHFINPKSRLFFVGNYTGITKYYRCLCNYRDKLSLKKSVIFTGHLKDNQVLAYYQLADAFVCMSEHEGFCVPLVEAMVFQVPILAYDSSAVSETLGGSGILLKEKNPMLIAEWMDRIVQDKALRQMIIEKEKKRLQAFAEEQTKKKFLSCIQKVVNNKIGSLLQ